MRNSRGLAFSQQLAGQAELQPHLHHLAAHGLQLQRHLVLGLRSAGKLLHVDVGRGQHFPPTLGHLAVQIDTGSGLN